MDYPTPTLNALVDGALLDMRFKFAMKLLEVPGFIKFIHAGSAQPIATGDAARCALNLAGALYAQGVERGWVEPLPTAPDLPPEELAHVKRNAAANVHGQLHAQRVANEAQTGLVMARGNLNG